MRTVELRNFPMTVLRLLQLGLAAALVLGSAACKNNDTATAPGALANIRIDAPDSVRSGQTFTADVSAINVGINKIRNGRVEVTLPAPLQVASVEASSGTASFANGAGAIVTWTVDTLDSNSEVRLHVHATGTLPAGSAAQDLRLRAMLTADGIRAGDAVAERTIQLTP